MDSVQWRGEQWEVWRGWKKKSNPGLGFRRLSRSHFYMIGLSSAEKEGRDKKGDKEMLGTGDAEVKECLPRPCFF